MTEHEKYKLGLGLNAFKCLVPARVIILTVRERPPASRALTSVSALDNSWRSADGVFSFNNTVLVYQLWGCGLFLCNA